MRNKKVLVLSLGRLALEEYTKNILKTADREKFDLWISKYSLTNYEIEIDKKVITYTNLFTFVRNSVVVLPILILQILRRRKIYDICYMPTTHPWNSAICFILNFTKINTVLTIHDVEPHPGEENIFLSTLNHMSFRMSKKLIYLSNHVKSIAQNRYNLLQSNRIINLGYIPIPNITFPSKVDNNILFIGRISKYKGVELLLSAINVIDKTLYSKLIIAGKALYDIEVPKSDKIEFINKYLSEEEIANLLSNCKIVVMPYLEASQSGINLLAAQAEKPLICTRIGGLTEQLSEKECLYINPIKEELSDALHKMLTDENLYNTYKQNISNRKRKLTWPSKTVELFDFFDDIRAENE